MKKIGQTIRFAATDISNHLSCGHLTSLALSEARGERTAPPFRAPDLTVIQQRGLDHEQAYVAHLATQGLSTANLQDIKGNEYAAAKTLEAMAAGVDVIVQGALASDGWFGRPDILRRVEDPSNFGGWSYEPYDCKLARETRAATILQLSHYAALLAVPRPLFGNLVGIFKIIGNCLAAIAGNLADRPNAKSWRFSSTISFISLLPNK